MKLTTLLDDGAILLDGDFNDKASLFKAIGETLAQGECDLTAEAVVSCLTDREGQGTTFLGRGVAVPHALAEVCGDIHLALLRPASPFPYDDRGHQVRLVFALLAPAGERDRYVRVLARIARLCLSEDFVSSLILAHDAAEVLALLERSDQHQCLPPGGTRGGQR